MTLPTAGERPLLEIARAQVRVGRRSANPWAPAPRLLWSIDTASIARGEFVLLAGRNGSGKSTLMRAALGLVPLDSGYVSWDGTGGAPRPGLVAYVPELPSFPVGMAAGEWLRFLCGGDATDLRAAMAAFAASADLGIDGMWETPLAALSKGQQQRIQIWAAILGKPAILVLDEPFSGLDPWARKECAALLLRAHEAGMAVWMASHEVTRDLRARCTHTWLVEEASLRSFAGCHLPE